MIEGIIVNDCYTVGDGDRCQTAAREESLAEARNTIGNRDGSQTATARVSITNNISMLSLLNGRKVKP